MLLFDGGVVRVDEAGSIRLAADELLAWRFVDAARLDEFVPTLRARRIRESLHGAQHSGAL